MSNNPKSIAIEDRVDLKSLTFDCIYSAINLVKSGKIEGAIIGANTKVFIFTNFGIVEGTPIPLSSSDNSQEENDDDVLAALYQHLFKVRNDRIRKLESENKNLRLVNDTAALVLKDVILRPYSNLDVRMKIDNMVLFTDQIVGLSFGQLSSSNSQSES